MTRFEPRTTYIVVVVYVQPLNLATRVWIPLTGCCIKNMKQSFSKRPSQLNKI